MLRALNELAAEVQQRLGLPARVPHFNAIYNDVDVYAGQSDGGPFTRQTGVPTEYTEVTVLETTFEINTVTCTNPSALGLLTGNDINMTALAVDCTGQQIDFTFKDSFWHFLLSSERRVALVEPEAATAQQLVRCAFKVSPHSWWRRVCMCVRGCALRCR